MLADALNRALQGHAPTMTFSQAMGGMRAACENGLESHVTFDRDVGEFVCVIDGIRVQIVRPFTAGNKGDWLIGLG